MTKRNNPFSQEKLNMIFRISPKDSNRLISRESGWLEFKESFNFASLADYLRTCAAFANAGGGYMVFGIKDKPHNIIGLNNNAFEKLDPAKLTTHINNHFDPTIEWEAHLHEFKGIKFGLLYVFGNKHKPVICTKSLGGRQRIKEGEIYYRYRGQTGTIRYPELRAIIDERRSQEQQLWLKHLAKIARIGVRESAIFDLNSGEGVGVGGTFVIDESLLEQLSFIKEGQFDERKGSPTIKIIGEAHPVSSELFVSTKEIIKTQTKGIRTPDIVHAFLDNLNVENPKDYITQICFETSGYLPVYYFIRQMKVTRRNIVNLLEEVNSTSQAKRFLIARLSKKDETLLISPPSPTRGIKKEKITYYYQLQEQKAPPTISHNDLPDMLQAIRMLKISDINFNYLYPLLKQWFDEYYGKTNPVVSDNLRRAICYLDIIKNRTATND